jgi:hypothetical protein
MPRWSLVRTSTLGSVDSGVDISSIVDVVVAQGETAYLLDGSPPFLRLVDMKGRIRLERGRSGEGPGEFRRPLRMGRLGDSLWIFDPALRRITFLNRDAVLGRTMQFNPDVRAPLVGADPVAFLGDGSILAGGAVLGSSMGNMMGVGGVKSIPVLLMTRAGKVIRKVAEVFLQVEHVSVRVLVDGRPGQILMQQPFNDDPLLQVAHDGSSVVIVERRPTSRWISPETFTVTKVTGRSDTVFSKQFRYTARPLDATTFERAVASVVGQPRSGKMRIEISEADVRQRMYRPEALTPVDEVKVASDGTIWLRRENDLKRDSVLYMVLSPEGNQVAEVVMSSREHLLDATASLAWVSSTSEEGAPILLSYRIRRP